MKKLILALLLISTPAYAQDFSALAEKTLPSVVSITSRVDGKELVGSGFVIDETGLIVTNNHVVDGAGRIDVVVGDKQVFEATVKGLDDVLDIALIKIEPFELLAKAPLGDSSSLKVGQWVMAVGNPFGLGNSVSVGVISAKSRDIESSPYDDFIQTDASINMGNSGGPLFDLDGNVVGMNTAMFSETTKSSGVGFALPSNQIKWALDELKKNGKIKRGWIGLKITPLAQGVEVSEIFENSPVQKAGLSVGDKILKINDVDIKSPKDLSNTIATTPVGQKVKIQTVKSGQNQLFDVDVIEKPETTEIKTQIDSCFAFDMEIDDSNLEVVSVDNSSDAFIKGLKKGDVIKDFDNNIMLNCQDITSYILESKRQEKQNIMVKIINKDGNTHFVELKL